MLIEKTRSGSPPLVCYASSGVRDANNNTLAGASTACTRGQHVRTQSKANSLPRTSEMARVRGCGRERPSCKTGQSVMRHVSSASQPVCRVPPSEVNVCELGVEQCSVNATMTIRRLLQLYELGECREAANIISRLPYATFRAVVLDLPVDMFVEAIPASLPILDALYAKVFFAGRDLLAFGFKFLHPENVVSHMIRMFAMCNVHSTPSCEESIVICKKLLKVILIADPSLRKQLLIKKALIDRAVEGMGHHGLVGTSNDALMNLHEALKLEFERVIQQYKGAIAKIDELSLTKTIKDGGPITRSLSQGPAPTFSSHQRLLSLKQEEIQDRLNKNRSLLCALEPCFRTNHSLQILLAILQKRIDYDKETLFQFGQLRKEYAPGVSSSIDSNSSSSGTSRHKSVPSSSNAFERDSVVAPILMRFSHGCSQVLNLLKEVQHETGGDDEEEVLTAHCIVPGPPARLENEPTPPVVPLDSAGCQSSGATKSAPTLAANADDSSDISGYHSDSDMSPISNRQSPLTATDRATDPNSTRVRDHFNSALNVEQPVPKVAVMTGRPDGTTLLDGEVSVNCGARTSVCESKEHCLYASKPEASNGSVCRIAIEGKPATDDAEVCLLRCELAQARARIEQLEVSHSRLQDKLTAQSHRLLALGGMQARFDNLDESSRVNSLIRQYEHLYSQVRVDVMDALDQFVELKEATELKTKLLFSIIVLAYRSTEQTLRDLRCNIRGLLRMAECGQREKNTAPSDIDLAAIEHEMESAIGDYLRATSASFDIDCHVQEVCSQIWNTLYDYPCLQKCPQLVEFVCQCARLCWSLHVQQSRFMLDIDTKTYREEWHSRVAASNMTSNTIKGYVWPTLFQEGICVHKGSILT